MPTCALVAASDFNPEEFTARWREGAYDFIIAVDGGLAHVRSVGCEPDLILGDFDSLGFVPEGGNVMKYPAHKDKSDLELALEHCFERGFGELVIYGALGRRLDHTVACLQSCARYAEAGTQITLVGDASAVRILVGPDEFEVPVRCEGVVSVFSAVDVSRGVTETGMEYLLEDAELHNRTTLGLSNELIGEPARVSVREGTLYVFYPLAEAER